MTAPPFHKFRGLLKSVIKKAFKKSVFYSWRIHLNLTDRTSNRLSNDFMHSRTSSFIFISILFIFFGTACKTGLFPLQKEEEKPEPKPLFPEKEVVVNDLDKEKDGGQKNK